MKSFQGESKLLKPPSRAWLVASILLLAAGLGFLARFGWQQYGYMKSSRYYQSLQQTAFSESGAGTASGSRIDFAALQSINGDVAAWLEMPGLGISLPVVLGPDNQTYLTIGFNGQPSPEGCLFFGVDHGGDEGLYRVIYGHNMHTGTMFGNLTNYQQESFYQQNPTFTLCTPEGDQTWQIFSCHEATDTEALYRTDYTKGEEYNAFVQELREASLYDTGVEVPQDSPVLTLSTCATSYGAGLDRFVVHACPVS